MSLFSANPVTINNGSDHVFSFRAQLTTSKSTLTAGSWVEDAAPIEDESNMLFKHDVSSPTVRRRLCQRKVNIPTTTRGLRPVTVNLTVTYDKEHAAGAVEAEVKLLLAAFGVPGMTVAFLNGHVQ